MKRGFVVALEQAEGGDVAEAVDVDECADEHLGPGCPAAIGWWAWVCVVSVDGGGLCVVLWG